MAKIRIEWARLSASNGEGGVAANQPLELFGAAVVVTVGSSAITLSAPTFTASENGLQGSGYARVTGLSGAVNAAWGDAPTATETTGWRIETGAFALLPVTFGQMISLIEALDPPAATGISPIKAISVSRSGTISVAGVAQDLMAANPSRNGWLIQNQSAASLYLRSKGASGTDVAAADNSSLTLPPGGYYEPPKIMPHALSIFAAVAGQAFFAEEW